MSSDIPTTMRASVLVAKSQVRVEERPVPVPADDEVLIKVASVGVCGSDVHYYREGRIGERVAIEPQRPCRVCAQCTAGRYNLCPHMKFYATRPSTAPSRST